MNAALYPRIHQIMPSNGQNSKYAHDTDFNVQLNRRREIFTILNYNTLIIIQHALDDYHPYVCSLITAR